MAKKKRRSGVSGNPAKRAQQQEPTFATTENDFRQYRSYYDDHAHVALTARGWVPFELDRSGGDIWDWKPSWVEPDERVGAYYEVTNIQPRPYGFVVDLSGPAGGPWAGARYANLDELLADIDMIETFRYGEPLPELSHAIEVVKGLPSPLSLRKG